MRILSVAYPLTQAGRDTAGGAEQILSTLDAELTDAGHQSFVIAGRGSKVKGALIASSPRGGTIDEPERRRAQAECAALIERALAQHRFDLVHMHGLDFHAYLPGGSVPVLATLHLPPDWYPQSIFAIERPHLYLNCVSRSERRSCPPSRLPIATIPNGVPVRGFEWRAVRSDYVLALGRICSEKGFHFALDAARLAGVEMILAGEVFPYAAHQRYFAEEILPRLDSRRRFSGPADFVAKRDLLAQAKCLLVPSTAPETSSLVAMEALASGTPVIAFPSGALPEIVEHGRTGFLVSSANEMARAIGAVGAIRPKDCRAAAEARFSSAEMSRRYLDLYRRILEGSVSPEPISAATI